MVISVEYAVEEVMDLS